MSIKEGKKPLSSKPAPTPAATDDIFGNALALPADIKAELDAKGLIGRWINATTLARMQGYNAKGWTVYRRSAPASDIMSFKFGSDPDGVVRRGDCILATKTKDQADLHRKHLQQKAQRGYNVNADKANELRSALGSAGIKAKVHEGYEEN